MTDIKQIKISLMESNGEVDPSTGKSDYILKTSATFQFNEYVEKTYPEIDEEGREQILKEASQLIYQDLLEKTKNKFDSVGVWLTIGDKVYETSITLSVMEGIQQYGEKGIVPIFELVKMTIPVNG
jgi:translation initiation factor IF-3